MVNAYDDYTTVLNVFTAYIHNHGRTDGRTFGLGYGVPVKG